MLKNLFQVFSMGCVLVTSTVLTFAQGSLTPSGAPAPGMKTLTQIEPRTPISALTTPGDGNGVYVINQPGSYYLTTNVIGALNKHGVYIGTGNVTIDLNGFAVQGGVPNSGSGILVAGGYTNIVIRNGIVSQWLGNGVDASASGDARNILIESLTVTGNGGNGIMVGSSSEIRNCTVSANGNYGIASAGGLVLQCVSDNNATDGIEGKDCIIEKCKVSGNGGVGIFAYPAAIFDCFAKDNGKSGIYVGWSGSRVVRNSCHGNNTSNSSAEADVAVNASNNRIEENQVIVTTGAGIRVLTGFTNNLIIKNYVSGKGTNNYTFSTNQVVGPLVSTSGTITNSNPWANFSY